MNITFSKNRSSQAITNEEFEEFENLIGYKLPEDYKNFMLEYNGGIVNEWEFVKHINYPKGEQGIVRLFSIKYDSGTTMEKTFRDYLDLLPKGCICIGINYSSSNIIISLNNDDTYGNIKEWTDEDMDILDLSPSFTQLLLDQVLIKK
jgi:hypothetical protein